MNCKCKGCGCEITEEEKQKVINEFVDEAYALINKYGQMPETAIAGTLIAVAKDLVCSQKFKWEYTVGLLQNMLNMGMQELWENHIKHEDKEEENATDTM
jgi:hypothetical protein